MKRFVLILFMGCTLVSCKFFKGEEPTSWENIIIEKDSCNLQASLDYPFCFGGVDSVSSKMNRIVEQTLKVGLAENEADTITLDSALTSLIKNKCNDTILQNIPYQFYAKGSAYTKDTVTSVILTKYYYTGGANGYSYTAAINFDATTGDTLSSNKLFKDKNTLLSVIRTAFLKKRNFTDKTTADSAGMFVTPSQVPMPANIGFDSVGIVAIYNHYEVGPRVFGETILNIPYTELKDIFFPMPAKDKK